MNSKILQAYYQAHQRNSTNRDGSQQFARGVTERHVQTERTFFTTCTLLGAAMDFVWTGQIRTLGPEAYSMTWEVLKKKMTDKYCLQGEIKKLEIELWNLKDKGNDFQI
ncbi:hypothetical protein Tco_1361935 [Tanacetum coccineum]